MPETLKAGVLPLIYFTLASAIGITYNSYIVYCKDSIKDRKGGYGKCS